MTPPDDVGLAPGEGSSYSYLGGGGLQYCAFRGRFTAKSVRGAALLLDLTTGGTLPTAPAQ